MPTFLVTKRMSPALAARVEASVSGRRIGQVSSRRRPLIALLRLTALFLVAGTVGAVVHYRQRSARELEAARAALLRSVQLEAKSLSAADREIRARIEATLLAEATPAYAGDVSAEELRGESRLAEALGLPMLYVRGPLESLAEPGGVARVARSSAKDAFVLCLLEPPVARDEKSLKVKARAAYAGGKGMQVASHVERVGPLIQALPLLGPEWERQLETAENQLTLSALRKTFEAAPVRAAVRGAKARRLLAVLDEKGDPKAPAELDGERPHAVRAILSDLDSGKILLRFRRVVDPSWLGNSVRAEYATGIDSCALALDLREALNGKPALLASSKEKSAR